MESETLTSDVETAKYPREFNDRPACSTKGLIASVCLVTAAISGVSYTALSKPYHLPVTVFDSSEVSSTRTTVHAYVDAL